MAASHTTPTWSLPYPNAADAPCGQTDLQNLATAVDSQLAFVRRKPNNPFIRMLIPAVSNIAANAQPVPTLQLASQSSHNIFAVNAGKLSFTQTGLYMAMLFTRWQYVSGTLSTAGWHQVFLRLPSGTNLTDWVHRTYGTSFVEVKGVSQFRVSNTANQMDVMLQNSSSALANHTNGFLHVVWIAD